MSLVTELVLGAYMMDLYGNIFTFKKICDDGKIGVMRGHLAVVNDDNRYDRLMNPTELLPYKDDVCRALSFAHANFTEDGQINLRDHLAGLAMQALVGRKDLNVSEESIAQGAVQQADSLIYALANNQPLYLHTQ